MSNLKILFDYKAVNNDLHIGWGFSVLIDNKILFDTGEKGRWLLYNIRYMNIDLNSIESVVISHDHWDHTGGLWNLLKHRRGLQVYGCPGFSKKFKNKVKKYKTELIEVPLFKDINSEKDFPEINGMDYILSSGEIEGEYNGEYIAEQSLIIKKQERNLIVLTGCAHSGIINILNKIKAKFKDYKLSLVLGGFHLMRTDQNKIDLIIDKFRQLGIEKVGATHCSGKEAEKMFKAEYKDKFIPIRVGAELNI